MADDNRNIFEKKRVIVPVIVGTILLILGVYLSINTMFYKSTDDAFVEGSIVTVAPRVSGPVVKMYLKDNGYVEKGTLLIEIDPTDYEVKLKQTQAKLLEAKATLESVQNELVKTNSELGFSKRDYDRFSSMHKKGIASTHDYDASKNALTVADANYKSTKAKYDEITATIKKLEAEIEQDKLNLSYTKIYAPQSGRVTNRNVEVGNYVQVAQPMFSLVTSDIWIVANFKETQVGNMHPGQPVKIKLDAYKHKKFDGVVDSLQMASGAKASLFPPENAVGSYVKIVQRIPVKIYFTEDITKYNVIPGMSVVPTVKVRGNK